MHPHELTNPKFRAVVENTLKADGALDAALFVTKLTTDATFQLGAAPPVTGRDAIQTMVAGAFAAFQSVEHRLAKVYELDDVLIYEAVVVYAFKDGRKAEIPYANFLEFEGDLVKRYRVYLNA